MEKLNYQNIIDSLYDGLYLVSKDRKITYWNQAAEHITGFSAEEVVGKRCSDNILIHVDEQGRQMCKGNCPLAYTMEDGESREGEFYLHHKKGHRLPVLVRTSPYYENGKIVGGIEVFKDNSSGEKLRVEYEKLKKLSLLDFLTDIPNRKYAESQLKSQLEQIEQGIHVGLLFIDVDHFKNVNDTYGHDTGDEVLKIIADSLKHSVRPVDIVGRWGGEEFISMHPNTDPETLEKIAERFRIMVKNSKLATNGNEISVTVSVGGTLSRKDDTIQSVVKRADELMYKSKQGGRDRVNIV